MIHRRDVVRSLFLFALGLPIAGCTQLTVVPLEPRANDELENIGRAPGPVFSWKLSGPTQRPVEYTLTITSQGEQVYSKARITDRRFAIPPGEGWLPGDASYEWRVEGQEVSEEGQVLRQFLPKETRSFRLKKRDTVRIQVSTPKVDPAYPETGKEEPVPVEKVEIVLGDETKRGDTELELENGESRTLVLKATHQGKTYTVGGTLSVVSANENTKLGKVLVSDLRFEEFERIAKEGHVGEHRYMLGGEEIARLKLGSRN